MNSSFFSGRVSDVSYMTGELLLQAYLSPRYTDRKRAWYSFQRSPKSPSGEHRGNRYGQVSLSTVRMVSLAQLMISMLRCKEKLTI